jgi:ElaB/YqjD/DUF883 family membrane-anchored ribosome-binding protein
MTNRHYEPEARLMEGTLRDKVSEAGEHLREVGHLARDAAQESVQRVKQTATRKFEQGWDRVKGLEEDVEGRIRSHPLKSVLIAAGVGFLLSLIVRRV